ncbi:nucleoside-diphosphate sugar epimerase/dehydratase [Limnohabitans sp. JirII-29]|uniref:polysaccharide biosynthesis protein n=1 Tax=Limnohabitans sp. JirII-29 TaxID=1835756 RepID=UPI0018EE9515|nr:nucleoside-diphosphate sugar epimerase/dehydratase [Limnohabitans sp. JirII-29]
MLLTLLFRNWKALTAGFLATVFAMLALFQQPREHYPVVKITNDDLVTTILVRATTTSTSCEETLKNIAFSIHSACSTCNTEKSSCTTRLTSQDAELLSGKAIANYSALLPNGVAQYESNSKPVAQQACLLSAQQSANKGFSVRCYEPNVERPLVSTQLISANSENIQGIWATLAAAALLALALQLAPPIAYSFGQHALTLPRQSKQALILLSDVLSIEVCLYLALATRLDSLWVPMWSLFPLMVAAPAIALPVFFHFGLYRAVMRYVGLHAIVAVVKAVAAYTLLLAVGILVFKLKDISLSVAFIHGLLTTLLIGTSRTLARQWLSQAQNGSASGPPRKRTVIFGAGSAGVQLALALSHSKEMQPVAFVDDDNKLHGNQIAGLTVYARQDLAPLIQREQITEVLLAIPSTSRAERNRIIQELEKLPVQVRTLPGVASLAEGKVKTSDLRDVEIEDLLGRDPVPPDATLLKANITGKAVMVTGAGGSIGSELCRQILAQHPRVLVLYELNEFALYSIEQELLSLPLPVSKKIQPILGSVTDPAKMALVLKRFGIETVFHAAAYKHVPMVEKNPCAGAFNNILGTWHTACTAREHKVETFVLVSTDKAVRPTNTMGTTKRVAELVLQALAQEPFSPTRFVMVRFGNVLGSSGSVVPVFREQIKNGGPITVTDPRIIRYFMTIPEAAQLVIQAGAMGHGGDVFVLDMGEPVKILDMARRMVHLSGLTIRDNSNPSGDIEIVFSGLRPGEKLYEELLIGDHVTPTRHPRIQRANEHKLVMDAMVSLVDALGLACNANDSDLLRELLLSAVKEFEPQCGNEDLLH